MAGASTTAIGLTNTNGDAMVKRPIAAVSVCALLWGCGAAGDAVAPVIPTTALSFTLDASTCSGTGPVDLFIEGARVASASLTAGVASQLFPVTAGSHVIAATATSTGSTWPSQQVSVPAGLSTTFVLPCTNGRQLAPYQATLQNFLTSQVNVDGLTEVLPAASGGPSNTPITYLGSRTITWHPAPAKYSDGTLVADDAVLGIVALTPGGTIPITASLSNVSFVSFSFTNASTSTVQIAMQSNGTLKCLATFPASATARFGYYVLDASTQVRIYKAGSGCTGSYLFYDSSTLAGRNVQSGFIALTSSTAP